MSVPNITEPSATSSRLPQAVLMLTTAISVWLLMQAIHELGHVIGGFLSGAELRRVVLHPLTISRTDFGHNPSPLFVCWMGPLFGAISPLLLWQISSWQRLRCRFWLQFLAGFCLIANGAYLAVGVHEGIGDAGDLIRYGSTAWQLYLFGAVTIPAGLLLWNGLGASFGLGRNAVPVTWRAAIYSLGLLIVVIAAELLLTWASGDRITDLSSAV